MNSFIGDFINKLYIGGKNSKLEHASNKIDNYLLNIYREFNKKKPSELLNDYTLDDILKFKEINNDTSDINSENDIIYEEKYDSKIQKLSAITDYFIYPCRMQCLVEGQQQSAYDIFINELSKNKNLNYPQKKDVLFKMQKHKNCTLLPFRRLIHIIKKMMNN